MSVAIAWYSSLGKVKLSRTNLGFLAFCSTAVLGWAGLAVSAALMAGLTIGLTKALLAGLLAGLVVGLFAALVAGLVAALVVVLGAVLVADFVTCFAAGLAALLETDLEAVLEEGLRGAETALGATGLTSAAGFAVRELGLLATVSGEGVVEEFIMHQRN